MFGWFSFAHHPLCKNYRHEVINVHGTYLCKGCTEVYGSSFLTILLVVIFTALQRFTIPELALIAFLTLIPSVIGNFYHFKRRIFKDIIRIALGIGLGIALSQLFYAEGLVTKIVVLALLIIAYFAFTITRKYIISKESFTNRGQMQLCSNCEQFNEQACENYKRVFKSEGAYSRIISDFIQKKLSANQIQSMGFAKQPLDED